jgi:hypothetical protein
MTKRIAFRIILVIAIFIIGFFYLLRSCLSKYDERSAIGGSGSLQSAAQFLVFEKDGAGVIFSLVKFDKTVSYSQKGGSINKSVNTTYYAQINDLESAAKNRTEKIKNHGQIKSYPVEIIGAADNKAWLFAGELMAYDPFTLTKVADAAIIEEKNPALKGKLINERRYYKFDEGTRQMHIITADGMTYNLNTSTLAATAIHEDQTAENTETARIKALDKRSKEIREQERAAYDRLRENNRLYREKQLPLAKYKDSASAIEKETATYRKLADSIEKLRTTVRETKSNEDYVKNLKRRVRNGSGFSGMKVNSDTIGGNWYGLYTNEKVEEVRDRFTYETVNDDAARNKFFTAEMTIKEKDWIIADTKSRVGEGVFLQGGFLLDKETGIPIRLPKGFLIAHKDRIGNDGLVQLTHTGFNGQPLWTVNTHLKDFYNWQLKGNKLIITGTDNKELSSGQINALQIINLQNGATAAYDFFTDKVRK